MWTNVDAALKEMARMLTEVMSPEHAERFVAQLETLITELVKAPPRGKSHPSRSKA